MASPSVLHLLFFLVPLAATQFVHPRIFLQAGYPAGFRAFIPDFPGCQRFAFHGKINNPFTHRNELGSIFQEVQRPQNGYWVVQDYKLILTAGDVIHFWTSVVKDNVEYPKYNQTWKVPDPENAVDILSPIQPQTSTPEKTMQTIPGRADVTTPGTSPLSSSETTTVSSTTSSTTTPTSTESPPTSSAQSSPSVPSTTSSSPEPTTTLTTTPTSTESSPTSSTQSSPSDPSTTSTSPEPTTTSTESSPTSSTQSSPSDPSTTSTSPEHTTTSTTTSQTTTASSETTTTEKPTPTQTDTSSSPTSSVQSSSDPSTTTSNSEPTTTNSTESSPTTLSTTPSSTTQTPYLTTSPTETTVPTTTTAPTTLAKKPPSEKRETPKPDPENIPPSDKTEELTTPFPPEKPISSELSDTPPEYPAFAGLFPPPMKPLMPSSGPGLEICLNPWIFEERVGESRTEKLERQVAKLQCQLALFQRGYNQQSETVGSQLTDMKKLMYGMVSRMANLESLLRSSPFG